MSISFGEQKTRKRFKRRKGSMTKIKTTKMKRRHYISGGNKKSSNQKENECPNSVLPCYWFDSHYEEATKINQTWHTCISMNGIKHRIIYITSKNVIIKSIETFQIPAFYVTIPQEKYPVECNIMIEDKFVGCFVNICGEWYAIMRLFGKTINTGVLARTEANKAYYKITNIKINANVVKHGEAAQGRVVGNSSITIPTGLYNVVNSSFTLMTSNSLVISLNNGCFTNITKKDSEFKVLQRFRQQKLFANVGKHQVIHHIIDDITGRDNML